ncbi:hypothetical protein ACJX0J_020567, partial [Zea mays]
MNFAPFSESIQAVFRDKNPYARLKTAKAHYILGTYQANLRMKLQASETKILKTNAQKILVPSIILVPSTRKKIL